MMSYRNRSRVLVNAARTAVQGIVNKHVALHTKCILARFAHINLEKVENQVKSEENYPPTHYSRATVIINIVKTDGIEIACNVYPKENLIQLDFKEQLCQKG